MSSPRRGEIWLADLNPQQGTTPGKTWPVLVVQATALSAAGHPSTLVLSLTTNLVDDAAPLRVRVAAHGRTLESDVMIDQLRAIDNRRLVKGPVSTLSTDVMLRVDESLREVLALG
jgi:mRNA interferase MazF